MTNFVRINRPEPSDPAYVPAPPAESAGRGAGTGRGAGGRRGGGQRIAQILAEVGVAVVLKPSRGEHGTVFVQGRDTGPDSLPTVNTEILQFLITVTTGCRDADEHSGPWFQ